MQRLFGVLILLFVASAQASDVRVGVLAFRGSESTVGNWGTTIEYLSRVLSPEQFALVPLDLARLRDAVAAEEIDFVLTNPGHYVELEMDFGISRIATIESAISDDPNHAIGSAVVVRREREDLESLTNLRSASLLAVDPLAFGGLQIALKAFSEAGLNPGQDFALRFSGYPMDRIALAVERGEADAGILRACLLEQMVAEGRIASGALRVLAPRNHYGFRCSVSTELYPDWPFSKTRHVNPELAKKVAQALFAMPAGHPAAHAGGYSGWTIPVDYQPVHDLLRQLHAGPYARDRELTLENLIRTYWHWLGAFLLAVLLVIWHGVRVEKQVRTRTAQLSLANERLKTAMQEQGLAEEKIRQHQAELAHAARVNTVGELAASMAHEINQPLAAIGNYAEGCLVRLHEQAPGQDIAEALREIESQATRAGAIVHRLRGFLRKEVPTPVAVDINRAVVEAVSLFMPEARRHNVVIRTELWRSLPVVRGEPIQLEQVVINLLRNGLEAMEGENWSRREMVVSTTARANDAIEVTVSDSGPGLSEEARRHLFEPFFTTKAQGMGLGLSTSRSIVEAHGGKLSFADGPEGGARATLTLPIAEE